MPEYEKITFENGFRLLLSEDSRAKSCSMGVWVGSGSCYESDDTAGISHFIEHMVFKGSALYSSENIASISDRMGGELNAYTDKECTCFYTRVLSADAPAAFELIADMVTSPRLDADDLELEKGVVCEEIAQTLPISARIFSILWHSPSISSAKMCSVLVIRSIQ